MLTWEQSLNAAAAAAVAVDDDCDCDDDVKRSRHYFGQQIDLCHYLLD